VTPHCPDLAPRDLLARSLAATAQEPLGPATVRWDRYGPRAAEELVAAALPGTVAFHTSGSTGPAVRWPRTSGQLRAEARLLADLVRADRPQAVLSFAPPTHLYGLVATVLLPAVLGLPLHYWPRYGLPAPDPGAGRWLIVAIPWAFPLLLRDLSVLGAPEQVTVLHSTATLPGAAGEFITALGARRVRLVELFGSTETGLVAHREHAPGASAWTLAPDVRFAEDGPEPGPDHDSGEIRLSVSGGRLALTPGGRPMDRWTTDDFVERLDDRRFRFHGRRGRLVKVNGRRIDLDHVEERLRAALPGADLVCVPVADRLRGERLDLCVAGVGDAGLVARRAADVLRAVGIAPGRIRLVRRIERSATGKPRLLRRSEEVVS
jgi:acyl-coenzyme A synthetase/AMP-(fatty) acid ligase